MLNNRMYDFLLFTTCDSKLDKLLELKRLLETVRLEKDRGSLNIFHIILLQNHNENYKDVISDYLNCSDVQLMFIPNMTSLSKARNIMMSYADEAGLFDKSKYIAFPDDDAWYPTSTLSFIKSFFEHNHNESIFICHYGSQPDSSNLSEKEVKIHQNNISLFIRSVSSNTIFARSDLIKNAGMFDENLGVGAPINGGEDLDYGLRLLQRGGGHYSIYSKIIIGHRDPIIWVRSRYYAGSLYALTKNFELNKYLILPILRKLAVGFVLCLKSEHTLKRYIVGSIIGLRGFFSKV